jgi:hypothetical protein
MARPRLEKKRDEKTAHPAEQRVVTMQFQLGDRFSDASGEWEVASRYVTNAGKNVHVRVRKVGQPDVTEIRIWRARARQREADDR